jgi:mannose-6-phosphate isomerase-like protein (cupin superfamily)
MIVRSFDDLEEYSPTGHEAVVNRLLVGESRGDGDRMSIWHGRFDPGGNSGLHVHQHSTQVYICLSGELVVSDGSTESILGPLATTVIPEATPHSIENRSGRQAEVLVISVPALR